MSEYPVLPSIAGQKFFSKNLKKEKPRAQTKLVMRNPFKMDGELDSGDDNLDGTSDLPPMLETLDVQPIVA